jgi:hypothetical protein
MSTGAWRWPLLNTATWQLSILPCQPDHCRATPTERSPCLAKLLSSMIRQLSGLAQQPIGVLSDLRHYGIVPLRRVADEMLELLRAAQVNHGRHRSKGAVQRLRQPAQVTPGHRRANASWRSRRTGR